MSYLKKKYAKTTPRPAPTSGIVTPTAAIGPETTVFIGCIIIVNNLIGYFLRNYQMVELLKKLVII